MVKWTKNKVIVTILILSGLFIMGYLGVRPFFVAGQFPFGFEPYGESVNQITNLVLVDTTFSTSGATATLGRRIGTEWDSKYWKIEQRDQLTCILCSKQSPIDGSFSGSDLSLNFATPQYERTSGYVTTFILTSKEDFSERDFKATFIGKGSPLNDRIASLSLDISLVGTSEIKGVVSHQFPGLGTNELNVVIHPRVVDNVVEIYVNGQKTQEVTMSGEYKIKIFSRSSCGYTGHGTEFYCDVYVTMKSPSYKQQFGCTKEAGEQYYVSIFNEGSLVNLNKLNNFKKFCLSEFPVLIHTNIGATTETSILADLVNGEQFVVPDGQIWTIEYIGEMGVFETECEENEVYNNPEDICMARTVLSLTCPSDLEFNFEKGYCTIETLPIEFEFSTIETHKDLENNNKFRFTQIKEDKIITSKSSFTIGNKVFSSNGLSYKGNLVNINYPDDKNNWEVSFSFNGQLYNGNIDNSFELDNLLSVKITNILGRFKGSTMSVEDFQIDYTFTIDTSFLETSYSDGIIIIKNNYQDFEGGITLTTTNNIGTTIVKDINKRLSYGETTFLIDTENILEIKIRPFIKISTPSYDYFFDSKEAIVIDQSQITILLGKTQDQIDLINSLELTLLEKAELIRQYTLNLEEQSLIVSQLEISLNEKIIIVQNLQTELNNQITLLSQLETSLAEKIIIVQTLTNNINEQAVIIQSLTDEFDEQVIIINSLDLQISEQATMINSLTTNLNEKAQLVLLLQIENEEQAQLISLMGLSFGEQGSIINLLNKEISDDVIIIQNLGLNLQDQAIVISNLELSNLEMAQLISEMEDSISGQAELINSLNLKIQDDTEIIINLGLSLEQGTQLINEMQLTLDEQLIMIEEFQVSLEEVDEAKINIGMIIIIIIIVILVAVIIYAITRKRNKMTNVK